MLRPIYRPPDRRGYTLRDLMIAMAVIGVLLALTAPAIQSARESTRRTQCVALLTQIGSGIHAYHNKQKMLPTGVLDDDGPKRKKALFWSFFILPYIGEQAAFDRVSESMKSGLAEANFEDGEPIAQVASTPIAAFICPSAFDPMYTESQGWTTRIPMNYGGNISGNIGLYYEKGGCVDADIDLRNETQEQFDDDISVSGSLVGNLSYDQRRRFSGLFYRGSKLNMAAATDGTSKTVAVGERYQWSSNSDPASLLAGPFGASRHNAAGGYWHTASPNVTNAHAQALGAISLGINRLDDQHAGWGGFRSRHPQGANFLMLDGSVRFVNENISKRPRAAYGTRNGGERACCESF